MKKKYAILSTLSLLAIGTSNLSLAAEFSPANEAELQTALTTAQNNGEDDTISLAAIEYNTANNGNAPFTYIAEEEFSLSIQGIEGSILSGDVGNSDGILVIDTTGVNDVMTRIVLSGVTVQDATPDAAPAAAITVDSASILVDNNIFQNNGSGTSYALEISGAEASNSTVNGNQFLDNGSTGVHISSVAGRYDITDNSFEGNGRGLRVQDDNNEETTITLSIISNSFIKNTYGISLSLANSNGAVLLDSNYVTSLNDDIVEAVRVFANNNIVTVVNNIIVQNNCVEVNAIAGGLTILSQTGSESNQFIVTNNTIADNTSIDGAGLRVEDVGTSGNTVEINNNIIFNNKDGEGTILDIYLADLAEDMTSLFATSLSNNNYSVLFSQCENDANCTPEITLTDNIDADPLFLDPANQDYHLGLDSPSFATANAALLGSPDDDFEGDIRKETPDQGALELVVGIIVVPSDIDFGLVEVGNSESAIFTITNEGEIPASITGIALNDDTSYALDFTLGNNACGSATPVLQPGESCEVTVIFTPIAEGVATAIVDVTSDIPGDELNQVNLTGEGFIEAVAGTVEGSGCSLGSSQAASSFGLLGFAFIALLIRRVKKAN